MDILVPILDNINKYEHAKGRPLLTALVVRADIGFPSTGFFDVASELDVFKTSADNEYLDRTAFLHSEVQRVFDAHSLPGWQRQAADAFAAAMEEDRTRQARAS